MRRDSHVSSPWFRYGGTYHVDDSGGAQVRAAGGHQGCTCDSVSIEGRPARG